jgi:hypothetical protein
VRAVIAKPSLRLTKREPSLLSARAETRWRAVMFKVKHLIILLLLNGFGRSAATAAAGQAGAGPLFSEFELTLALGHRTEIVSPFYYSEQKEDQHTWAIPPLTLAYTGDPTIGYEEFDFAYPLLTYDRFGTEYRWQFFQLFSIAGGIEPEENQARRFTLFPIYFQQRAPDPALNYTAVFPLGGTIKNRLFRDEIDFVLFPLYVKTRKRDVTTYSTPYPFFSRSYGDGLFGWQAWPLVGREHKDATSRTNGFGDAETVPGHDRRFVLWPFFTRAESELGTTNPVWQEALIPLYSLYRSPSRDSSTYFWPLGLTHTVDRGKQFHEWAAPWPLIVFDRGEGKTTSRVWPFMSRSRNQFLESDWYMWPVYKYNRVTSAPLDRGRTRILFFLYSVVNERNKETGESLHRVDFWPLFTRRRDFNGNDRLQILSIIEPVLPANKSIERDYSHLYALWRAERNPRTGAASQSLLWNLYRRETAPEAKKISLLFGLFQYQSSSAGRSWRLCYIPAGGAAAPPRAPEAGR